MNEITVFAPMEHESSAITVRIGDRFQSVSIKKTADNIEIADALHKWADNIKCDELMGDNDNE